MTDIRTTKLAKLVVNYCLEVKPDEDIIISASSEAEEFVTALFKQIIIAKGNPLIKMHPKDTDYFYFKHATNKQLKHFPKDWFETVKSANGFIEVDTEFNTRELSKCDSRKIDLRRKTIEPITEHAFFKGKIKNVVVAYPCLAYAIEADMSFDEWKDFVFSSCLIDWEKLAKKYKKIADEFDRGEEVHLIGDDVNLKFLIKNRNALLEKGKENMPGGEIYMAPIKKTLKGEIKFEYPSMYNGKDIKDIFLKFDKGKVVSAKSSKNEKVLRQAIKADANASYVGEFGIGVNPSIKKFTNNLLFDEKMFGTIHLALGAAYKENGGGNDSMIHWDLIKDMKNSEILLDDKVVYSNKKWRI